MTSSLDPIAAAMVKDIEPASLAESSAAESATVAAGRSSVPEPIIRYGKVLIRSHYLDDAPALATLANNPKIAKNLRNRFPNPYGLEDAFSWLSVSLNRTPKINFAICTTDGTLAGGIGLILGTDVEHRNWEMGYWLGEPFWGQGLATDAATAFSRWVFKAFPEVVRLQCQIFETNLGSQRVAAKAGFTYEGNLRKAVEKNGQIMDLVVFSLLREEVEEWQDK